MYHMKKKDFIRQLGVSENRHIAVITLFFLGAVLVSWKIEQKYDRMRARVNGAKSQQVQAI